MWHRLFRVSGGGRGTAGSGRHLCDQESRAGRPRSRRGRPRSRRGRAGARRGRLSRRGPAATRKVRPRLESAGPGSLASRCGHVLSRGRAAVMPTCGAENRIVVTLTRSGPGRCDVDPVWGGPRGRLGRGGGRGMLPKGREVRCSPGRYGPAPGPAATDPRRGPAAPRTRAGPRRHRPAGAPPEPARDRQGRYGRIGRRYSRRRLLPRREMSAP